MTLTETKVLRMAILLGRRVCEIAGARREDVRHVFSIPHLFIPGDRNGNKAKRDDAVPLPSLALGIAREVLSIGQAEAPLFLGAATRWLEFTGSQCNFVLRPVAADTGSF